MKRPLVTLLAAFHGVALAPTPRSNVGQGNTWSPLFLGPTEAIASPAKLAAARQLYAVGDIPGAARALQPLAQGKSLRGTALEDAQKLYGICLYLLGNKPQAEALFAKVLKSNPSARLVAKDIIDPTVGQLFERIRGQVAPARKNGSAKPGQASRPKRPSAPEKRGFTGIHVKTNAKNTTVFANGIFIGTGGQDIALDPGEHKITISAQGHEEVTRAFTIKPSERLTLTVNLVKAGERERRAALAAAARAKEKREAELAREREAAQRRKEKEKLDYTSDLPPGAKPSRASQSLADEFFRDGQAVQMRPVPPQQAQATQNPYAPPPAVAQPGPVGRPVYAAPPQQAYAPPAYGPYGAPQPVVKRKSMFLALLPFGSGQYQNGSIGLGLVFTVVDLGALAMFAFYTNSAKTFDDNNIRCSELPPDRQTACDGGIPDAQFDEYKKGQEQLALISLAVFGVGWIAGATEAVLSMNSPPRPGPMAPPPPPAYYGFQESAPAHRFALERKALQESLEMRNARAPTFSLQPVASPQTGLLGLGLKVNF